MPERECFVKIHQRNGNVYESWYDIIALAGEIQAPCLRMGAVESPNKSLIIPAGQSQLRSRGVTNIFDF